MKPKLLKVEGMITAISIRFIRPTYEITYFNSGDLKTIWLDAAEFEILPTEKASAIIKVGFKNT